jgi:glycosyltransferase involved in cell wall biosynthesis
VQEKTVRVLVGLTYYRPYTSGLTLYAERLARALAQRGHAVSVLTSRHQPGLPQQETLDSVQVHRLNVAARISKGAVMPGLPWVGWKLVRQADVVNLHLPQLDAALLAVFARLMGKRLVVTYHCDLQLPSGLVNRLANAAVNLANHITARLAHVIVTNTQDYAEHSPFLRRYLKKVRQVYPPAFNVEQASGLLKKDVRQASGEHRIGIVARLAAEKGVEYLVQALPIILEQFPNTRLLYVGQYQNVLGEAAYARRAMPLVEALGEHWTFLGPLPDQDLPAFFQACSVTVLPSLNSTESFGMVQVESMACGTPVVASNLPGMRQPVLLTGMGEVVPPANPAALASAILRVLKNPGAYAANPKAAALVAAAHPDQVAAEYEQIFNLLLEYPANQRLEQGG